MDEKINESVLQWLGHMERMENNTISKRVYELECAGSRTVGKPRKGWIDTMKDCLKKRSLDVRQAKRVMYELCSVLRTFLRENAWGVAWGMNP